MGSKAVALWSLTIPLAGCGMNAKDLSVTAAGSYWKPEVNGDMQVLAGSNDGTGGTVDVDDLGLDGDYNWTARVDVSLDQQRLGLEYLPLEFEGEGIAGTSYQFHGRTFGLGDFIEGELQLETWILRWDWLLESRRNTADAFRIGLNVWWWNYDMRVHDATTGVDASREFSHVYPGVHAQTTFDLNGGLTFDLMGSAAMTSVSRQIFDVDGALGWQYSDAGKLLLGYRWLQFDYNETTNDGDFDFRGPYLKLTFGF